jgi:hypothetical protein
MIRRSITAMLVAATVVAASMCLIPTVWSHHSRLDVFFEACEECARRWGGAGRWIGEWSR